MQQSVFPGTSDWNSKGPLLCGILHWCYSICTGPNECCSLAKKLVYNAKWWVYESFVFNLLLQSQQWTEQITLHMMQQVYATRTTTPMLTPAFQGMYHACHADTHQVQCELKAFDIQLCHLINDILSFLSNWNPAKVCWRTTNLGGKVWDTSICSSQRGAIWECQSKRVCFNRPCPEIWVWLNLVWIWFD